MVTRKGGSRGRRRRKAAICRRKIRYFTWEEARHAGMRVWEELPSQRDANPPLPYACDLVGEPHYHIGHLRFAQNDEYRASLALPD